MAIVPPTLAPNCGQPHAMTAKAATAPAAASARYRSAARLRPTQATAMTVQTAYRPTPAPPMP